jgi:hypothetical protein
MTDFVTETVDFIQRRESSAVEQALAAVTALHDALALKWELRLPVVAETRAAILELEDQILALKLESLRAPHHPDQLVLPGMEGLPVAKEGKQEASRGDMAS